ncbi:hypothetical protein Q2941_04735 [Bradyrhizobium sp. UFLA05-153]
MYTPGYARSVIAEARAASERTRLEFGDATEFAVRRELARPIDAVEQWRSEGDAFAARCEREKAEIASASLEARLNRRIEQVRAQQQAAINAAIAAERSHAAEVIGRALQMYGERLKADILARIEHSSSERQHEHHGKQTPVVLVK